MGSTCVRSVAGLGVGRERETVGRGATEEISVYWQYLIAYIGCCVRGAWLFIFFKLSIYVTHTFL